MATEDAPLKASTAWRDGVQRYIEMSIPPNDWTLGKLKDFVTTCEAAGAVDETPMLPPLTSRDPKVQVVYVVLRCDIDT